MTQITIDDLFAEVESKRLVKNHLTTLEWNVLKKLKAYNIGKENAVAMETLAEQFNVTDREIRKVVKRLRQYQEVMISSCNKGYYIPLECEQQTANKMLLNRALSSLDTILDNSPKSIGIIYKHLNEKIKTLDIATQNQIKIQFNGWERETVNYFGDKYKGK